jgi:hypothetical protein
MSFTEINEQLPRLSDKERRELCRRVIDLESEQEDMMLCDHIAARASRCSTAWKPRGMVVARASRGEVGKWGNRVRRHISTVASRKNAF